MRRFLALLPAVVLLIAGCSHIPLPSRHGESHHPYAAFAGMTIRTPDGATVAWTELHGTIASADAILLAETHDSPEDHAFQAAFLLWTLEQFQDVALAMEQLERDEQQHVDAYLRGEIDTPTFITETDSADWAGQGSWRKWYQPLVDLARSHHAPVIAANAPRKYSRIAYKEGLDALEALPPAERRHFDLPLPVDDEDYRVAFARQAAAHEGVTPEMVEAMYAGQQVWDSTMAASISRGLDTNTRIVLTVGRFHVEHSGGLTAQLLARHPGLTTVTLLPQPEEKRVTLRMDGPPAQAAP